jgi:hypothetical protein
MEGNPLHETVHTSFGTVCAVGVVVKKQNPYQNIIFFGFVCSTTQISRTFYVREEDATTVYIRRTLGG